MKFAKEKIYLITFGIVNAASMLSMMFFLFFNLNDFTFFIMFTDIIVRILLLICVIAVFFVISVRACHSLKDIEITFNIITVFVNILSLSILIVKTKEYQQLLGFYQIAIYAKIFVIFLALIFIKITARYDKILAVILSGLTAITFYNNVDKFVYDLPKLGRSLDQIDLQTAIFYFVFCYLFVFFCIFIIIKGHKFLAMRFEFTLINKIFSWLIFFRDSFVINAVIFIETNPKPKELDIDHVIKVLRINFISLLVVILAGPTMSYRIVLVYASVLLFIIMQSQRINDKMNDNIFYKQELIIKSNKLRDFIYKVGPQNNRFFVIKRSVHNEYYQAKYGSFQIFAKNPNSRVLVTTAGGVVFVGALYLGGALFVQLQETARAQIQLDIEKIKALEATKQITQLELTKQITQLELTKQIIQQEETKREQIREDGATARHKAEIEERKSGMSSLSKKHQEAVENQNATRNLFAGIKKSFSRNDDQENNE